jgi:heme/copper-type cytochrome/quinol oxidase subunit 3
MAQGSTARKLDEAPPVRGAKRPGFGGGKPPPPVRPNVQLASNLWLAVLMLLGAEAMFFAGLIGAFLVFRIANPVWPPPFQPRLPIEVTGVNTVILLVSAITIRLGVKAIQRGDRARLVRRLSWTAAAGAIFLSIQGIEWFRLIHFGLTLSSSIYGGLFYTIIGCHALHVLGALIWLLIVWQKARAGKYTRQNYLGLQTCSMYWLFVVGLWPVLYGLVYLY